MSADAVSPRTVTHVAPVASAPSPAVGLVRGLAWLLALAAVIPTRADPDLWGNLRFGLDLLATPRISTVDAYSFTQDLPWFNHEWLAQVMMAASYQMAGAAGLVGLKAGLVLGTLWLVARAYRGARPLLAEGAALLVLVGAIAIVVTLRAQLWSFLGLAVLFRLLEDDTTVSRRAVPVLFAVWVNCHIGWVIGLAVLVWWSFGRLVRGDGAGRRAAVIVVAASLAATLANPYGWHQWRFTAGATHLSRNLSEWQSLWTSPVSNWIGWLLAVGLAATLSLRAPRMRFELAICVGVLAVVSAQVVKFAPIFVELTALSLAPVARLRWPDRSAGAAVPPAIRWVNRAACAALGAAVLTFSWPRFHCLPADAWRPDATIAQALIDVRAAGRIAVWFDWGEYVIWHRGPALRVSFDPRYDLLYSAATIDEQEQVARGTGRGTAFLERTRPEYVWYPTEMTQLKHWLAANGYRIDIETGESFLAVRADLPPVPHRPAQAFGCFPSP
jgi:hypothetical protein